MSLTLNEIMSHPPYLAKWRWENLMAIYRPKVFYDIGCNDPYDYTYGAVSFFKNILPSETEIYLFEASTRHINEIKSSGFPYNIDVLSDSDGKEVEFFESRAANHTGTGDSYYRENTSIYSDEYVIKSVKETKKLDSVIKDRDWNYPDIIKIDTQGSELDILKGAKECLTHAKFALIECAVQNYNQNAPRIDSIIKFMDENGFSIFDIFQIHYVRNQINQMDIMFCKKDHDCLKLLQSA